MCDRENATVCDSPFLHSFTERERETSRELANEIKVVKKAENVTPVVGGGTDHRPLLLPRVGFLLATQRTSEIMRMISGFGTWRNAGMGNTKMKKHQKGGM